MIDKNANGCIMADGMGLGKTVCRNSFEILIKPNIDSFNVFP